MREVADVSGPPAAERLPVGRKGRAKSLVVFKGLARAVRRESGVAVAHHWSVDKQTVWKWRKALGVGRVTEGTSKRLSGRARRRRPLAASILSAHSVLW